MWPTHPDINPETTLSPSGHSPGHNAPQEDATPQATPSVTFSIPLNTEVAGSIVTCVFLQLPSNIIFGDFFSCVCAHMDISPTDGLLGYKFSGDPACMLPYRLSNEEELHDVIKKGIGKMTRSQKRDVFIEIHNLVCNCEVLNEVSS
jgi:hypothetical protein